MDVEGGNQGTPHGACGGGGRGSQPQAGPHAGPALALAVAAAPSPAGVRRWGPWAGEAADRQPPSGVALTQPPAGQRRSLICLAAGACILLLVFAALGAAVARETWKQHSTSAAIAAQQQQAPPLPRRPTGCESVEVVPRRAPGTTAGNATTGRVTLNGTVKVVNSYPYVVALERVTLRLCSSISGIGHLRQSPSCPGGLDVPAGGEITCSWSVALPDPSTGRPESRLAAWTGMISSVELALNGERCVSEVVDPSTGGAGTCSPA